VGDLEEIGEKILKKSADYGILPVENSTEGFIGASFDLLNFYPLKIFLELRMEIHLYLVSSVPLSKVRRIYSHPQPFSQAQRWLRRYTPSAEKIPTSSTAQAFLSLKEDREGGAIVSPFLLEEGGKEYPFVYGPVEDSPRNTTRFWVVGENSKEKETPKGGNSSFRRHNLKTTLFFVLPHRPGTLSKVLHLFSDHRLNLTSIFSRPIPDAEWEYRFFVDVEGDFPVSSKKFLSLLRRRVVHFRVLGVYPSVDLPSPKISREVLSVKEKDL
jgi:chorismate mutase/prephenate dehydratase